MSKLIIVPTPIGNLKDITFRAIEVLQQVDIILAEDSRNSGKLLKNFEIETTMWSYHQHNEHSNTEKIVADLKSGKKMALITDAGTPGISDPGFLLVRACINNGIEVECLPGPTAFVPALINSGLPCDRFVFEGFLPQKKGRQKRLLALAEENRTMVFYESPHRIIKALDQFIEVFGAERLASASRELTKLHEENVHGSLLEIKNHFGAKAAIKGEFVIVVAGK